MKNFKCYQMAIVQYKAVRKQKYPRYVKDQVERAALSVCLNLAEGSGKTSERDRRRFYEIALGSQREVQAVFEAIDNQSLGREADKLAGGLFNLVRVLASRG